MKRILIADTDPVGIEKEKYEKLVSENSELEIEFRSFNYEDSVSVRSFKENMINFLLFDTMVFPDVKSVDFFFKLVDSYNKEYPKNKVIIPFGMQYFCVDSETSLTLQKYIQLSKNELFIAKESTFKSLADLMESNLLRRYLVLSGDARFKEFNHNLRYGDVAYITYVCYQRYSADLTGFNYRDYDLLVFFSRAALLSFVEYETEHKQLNKPKVLVFDLLSKKLATKSRYIVNTSENIFEFLKKFGKKS